ncbi:MAG: SDR family NAD(P)-dependent oxidoreductase [Candidatus Microsaccharimonas sp.]
MVNTSIELKNSTIVIVGASSGFGRGAALELARQGANVVVAARRTKLLDELVAQIKGEGGDALAVTADVSIPEDIEKLTQKALDTYKSIDIWINNVGVGALGYFWDIPIDVHARVVDVNLKGLIYGAHAALRHFIAKGRGTLINVGSIDSEVPLALQNTYAATKSAVLSLGKSLNEELRLSGYADSISVATIMPWAVDTPWWTHAANYSGHAPRMAGMDDPELVVEAIVKACTDPKEKIPVGPKATMSNISHQLFPKIAEQMSANISKKERDKAKTVGTTNGTLFSPMKKGAGMDGGIRERMKREDAQAPTEE